MSISGGKSVREVQVGSRKGVERLKKIITLLTSNLEIIIYATNLKKALSQREKILMHEGLPSS